MDKGTDGSVRNTENGEGSFSRYFAQNMWTGID